MIERKYGIEFPVGTNEATMELAAYSLNVAQDGDREKRVRHMLKAMRLLWDEKTFGMHQWTERRVKAWCAYPFFTMWGPSSSGKSTDQAAIILIHWLSAPAATTAIVCSTTREALTKRIFGEIVRLYEALQNPPGRYLRSRIAIVTDENNPRNGIFGVPILKGTLKEAMGNMIGTHNRRVVLVIDEMQATREAAVEAVSNLQGGEDFHFVGIGNPESRLDPLGRYSEPVDSWESIDPTKEDWVTKFGHCLFFDGRKSPAIIEEGGDKRFPYLLQQKDIDQRLKWYGENSPKFWSQTIGFIPPEGLLRTIFAESFFVKYKMMDRVTWGQAYQVVGGLDPAFSSGGDRCALSFAKVGEDKEGVWRIEFEDPVIIPIEISRDEPIAYKLARRVKEQCSKRGVDPGNLAVDTTGTQGTLVDVLDHEWSPGIMRVNFGGKPTNLPVSIDEQETGRERYSNRVTELWHTYYQFGRFGQIRGVAVNVAKEFCSRILLEKLRPITLEPKTAMKARAGYSPDLADSEVIVTALVKERLGIIPGAGKSEGGIHTADGREITPQEMDVDGHEENYTISIEEMGGGYEQDY